MTSIEHSPTPNRSSIRQELNRRFPGIRTGDRISHALDHEHNQGLLLFIDTISVNRFEPDAFQFIVSDEVLEQTAEPFKRIADLFSALRQGGELHIRWDWHGSHETPHVIWLTNGGYEDILNEWKARGITIEWNDADTKGNIAVMFRKDSPEQTLSTEFITRTQQRPAIIMDLRGNPRPHTNSWYTLVSSRMKSR